MKQLISRDTGRRAGPSATADSCCRQCGLVAVRVHGRCGRVVGNFTVMSRRHVGCPFSVTLYVNGSRSGRLSACCECRHKAGSRLGGRHGHFALVSVTAAKPCYRWSTLPPSSSYLTCRKVSGGSVAEWLACWTQAQKGRRSNHSRDAVG